MVRGNIKTFLNIPSYFFRTSFLFLTLPRLSDELAAGAVPKSGASPAAAPGTSHRSPQICTGTGGEVTPHPIKSPSTHPKTLNKAGDLTLAKPIPSKSAAAPR